MPQLEEELKESTTGILALQELSRTWSGRLLPFFSERGYTVVQVRRMLSCYITEWMRICFLVLDPSFASNLRPTLLYFLRARRALECPGEKKYAARRF